MRRFPSLLRCGPLSVVNEQAFSGSLRARLDQLRPGHRLTDGCALCCPLSGLSIASRRRM